MRESINFCVTYLTRLSIDLDEIRCAVRLAGWINFILIYFVR